MRTIFRIARVELSTLFYSPIAWFLLILFYVQVAMAYVNKVESYVTTQELGQALQGLTFNFFANPMAGGIFISEVLSNLYLYIPLITMGLISREVSNGTIKLLYSSPLKLSHIVLGKYLAMLVFNLCMIAALAIIAIFAAFHIDALDWGIVGAGLFGIFLLLSAYAAIGLFMSCLSSYQVVAAIATFAVFALLKFVGSLWQDYDFLRDLTNYLSISGRTETIIMGLINTRDILYYLLITGLFLCLAWFKLQGERALASWPLAFAKYTLVIGVVLMIGYVTSTPGYIGYWDVTRTHMNTLSVKTQEALKAIGDETLEVTNYINLLDRTYYNGSPKNRNADKRRWERYQRFKPNIKLKYVYYYDSAFNDYLYNSNKGLSLDGLAEKYAKSYKIDLGRFKKPAEIQQEINLYPEKNRLVMLLKFKGKSTFLRTFDDMMFWPSETEVTAALRRLTVPLPVIAFLQGEEERRIDRKGDKHYKLATSEINVRASLMNQGFDVKGLSLKDDEIPKGLTALVIADPRADFAPQVLEKINRYIDEGGNLLLAGEPGKQSVLNPILYKLGMHLMDGTIVQGNTEYAPEEVKSLVTSLGAQFGRKVTNLYQMKLPVSTRSAAGLTYQHNMGFTVRELLRTDAALTWNKTGKIVLDSADIVYNPKSGDVKAAIPTALALTRKVKGKEQHILVTGDADFLSNAELANGYSRAGNADFYQGFLGWFTYGQFPIEPTWPDPVDNTMTIKGTSVTPLRWTMLGLLPALGLIAGTVLLIRRKRK
ncbi:ABC-2 type transport system permease protein [bacterium A37T11]|nr:ABC-2 type transport system permease protein [bacterium A37T11]